MTNRLIAIVGGSGAGKTWLAERLQQALGRGTARLSLDNFYRDLSHLPAGRRARINFDHPRAIDWKLLQEVLDDCGAGRTVHLPQYDFASHTRSAERVLWRPGRWILMDGLWLLRLPAIRRLFAVRIYLDCHETVRFQRRLKRDVMERGRSEASVRTQFTETVAPMHARYVAPQKRWANVLVKGALTRKQVNELAAHLKQLLTAVAHR